MFLMYERTRSFDMKGQKYSDIQKKVENILQKSLMYSIKTLKLGKTLLRINYTDNKLDVNLQRENRVTILQESDKRFYIQVTGQLTDDQVSRLWSLLEKDLKLSSIHEENDLISVENKSIQQSETANIYHNELNDVPKHEESNVEVPKDNDLLQNTEREVVEKIIGLINMKGYTIEQEEAQNFINNFRAKYNRLPKEVELNSIAKGYIIMSNEDFLKEKSGTSVKSKNSTEAKIPFKEEETIS
ncbi:hypothetical protein LCGC14_2764860, partial [marine sediment metagenome]